MSRNSLYLFSAGLLCAGLSAQNQQFVPTSSLNASNLANIPSSGRTTTAAGDLDGDGDYDLVMGLDPAPPTGPSIRILRNGVPAPATGVSEAYGTFSNFSPPSITRRDRIYDIKVFDADGDGDEDILYVTDTVVNAPLLTQVALLRQTSPDVFSSPQYVFATQLAIPITCEIVDMNGDGRMDVVVGMVPSTVSPAQGVAVLTNGPFGFSSQILGAAYSGMSVSSLAVDDIDGDGDLDIVAGCVASSASGFNRQNVLYRNNGNGSFTVTTAGMPVNAFDTNDILLVDVFGSSLPELVVADTLTGKSVHSNLGGSFGGAFATFGGGGGLGSAGDIDLDGDMDLVFGNQTANTQVLVNNNGILTDTPIRVTADGACRSSLLVDMDRDNDLDIVQGLSFGAASGVRAQVNLHRQIDLPTSALIGSTIAHDWYDRPGYGNGHVPTAYFSPAAQTPRFEIAPFGFVGVDLAQAIVINLATSSSGKNSVALPIPNDPNLVGQTWFWQWLIMPNASPQADWGLSNVVPITFL
ncbi:MAG: FG-GAP repeat domain-containing protein [Planctomycetota bacterium]